jgi:hypothetical protein
MAPGPELAATITRGIYTSATASERESEKAQDGNKTLPGLKTN